MSSAARFGELVIGTHNRKKGAELAEMLAPWGVTVLTLADLPDAIEVVEDGDTFAANAALKATKQARHLSRWVLADDSGLEVDALAGAPGVYSARFAELARGGRDSFVTGSPLSYSHAASHKKVPTPVDIDEDNNRLLLERLGDAPLEKRTAQYVCHVTLADPTGAIRGESHDVCRGRIRYEPAGWNGFGYDPLFEVVEYHRTFGELGPSVKRAISHRARAMRAMLPLLRQAWSHPEGTRPGAGS